MGGYEPGVVYPEKPEWEVYLDRVRTLPEFPGNLSSPVNECLCEVWVLRALVKRCRPFVEADAQMMAYISRFAPLSPEDQAKHDTTEYPSEVLLRDLDAAGIV